MIQRNTTLVRTTLLVSVTLNVFSAAIIVHLIERRPPAPVTEVPARESSRASLRHSTVSPAPRQAVHTRTQFDWRQIESADYRSYIENLRAIGCPETTIRDIIVADVNALFASKRSQIIPSNGLDSYWDNRFGSVASSLSIEEQAALQELSEHKRAVLKELIGVDAFDPMNSLPDVLNPLSEVERRLRYLPEDKRKGYVELMIRGAEALQYDPPPEERLSIETQIRREVEDLLTPGELYELDLRESLTSAKLRGGLMNVQPTEQEFRTFSTYGEGSTRHGRMDVRNSLNNRSKPRTPCVSCSGRNDLRCMPQVPKLGVMAADSTCTIIATLDQSSHVGWRSGIFLLTERGTSRDAGREVRNDYYTVPA